MNGWARVRIQLCGRFAVEIDGSRIEDRLPGRRGRVLFAYLVLHRGRPLSRDELLMAGWGDEIPTEAGNALTLALDEPADGPTPGQVACLMRGDVVVGHGVIAG